MDCGITAVRGRAFVAMRIDGGQHGDTAATERHDDAATGQRVELRPCADNATTRRRSCSARRTGNQCAGEFSSTHDSRVDGRCSRQACRRAGVNVSCTASIGSGAGHWVEHRLSSIPRTCGMATSDQGGAAPGAANGRAPGKRCGAGLRHRRLGCGGRRKGLERPKRERAVVRRMRTARSEPGCTSGTCRFRAPAVPAGPRRSTLVGRYWNRARKRTWARFKPLRCPAHRSGYARHLHAHRCLSL